METEKHVTQSRVIIERVIIDWFRKGCDLTSTERLVLLMLARFCNADTLVSWPGQKVVADSCGFSRGTINKAVSSLQMRKLLEIRKVEGRSHIYDLTPVVEAAGGVFEDDTRVNEVDRGVIVSPTGGVGQGDTNGAMNGAKRTIIRFRKPTVAQVQEFLDAEGIDSFDGAEFVDANEMKGWKVGKHGTPMKNWKAACRTWDRNRKKWGEPDANYREKELAAARKEETGD